MAWRRIQNDEISDESDKDGDIGVRARRRLTDDTSDAIDKPARWKWCILVVVVTLASLCIFGQSSLLQNSMKSRDISNLQETQVDPTPPPASPQGGTLEPGPGCPSVCGSFVACSLNISSANNLYPLEIYQRIGLFPFPEFLNPTVALTRLFNKQLVPYSPDFQCPGTDCFIPNAFVNDDFCDCPIDCSDEIAHSCESCGLDLINNSEAVAPGVGCPNFCGGLNDLSEINCLGTGSSTAPRFACPDSACEIDAIFVNDNRCDCPFTCADETNWTCDNCSCPSICGVAVFDCDGSGVYSCSITSANQTCNIPGAKVGDGVCDCPGSCEEEQLPYLPPNELNDLLPPAFQQVPPDCDYCTCPTACGQDIALRWFGQECVWELLYSEFLAFDCGSGCLIPRLFVKDGYCDCPGTCADEADEATQEFGYGAYGYYYGYLGSLAGTGWTCETCECPTQCGFVRNGAIPCGDPYFQCPGSNCKIPLHLLNDNACDCPGCEDEKDWTCDTCDFGCQQNQCGISTQCRAGVFECGRSDERCELLGIQVNDNVCDCPNCEDEEFWDCNNCTCPSSCQAPFASYDEWAERRCSTPQELFPDAPIQCPGARDPVTPDRACVITGALLDNNRCDCPGSCADENFDAEPDDRDRPGNPCVCQRRDGLPPADCPQSCGDIVPECPFSCDTEARFPCFIPSSAKNDGRCDCPGNCDDEEGRFTCPFGFFDEPTPNTDECFCPFSCEESTFIRTELDVSQCPGSVIDFRCQFTIFQASNEGVDACEFCAGVTGRDSAFFFCQEFLSACSQYCPPPTALKSSAPRLTPKMRERLEALLVAFHDPKKLMALGFNQTRKAPKAAPKAPKAPTPAPGASATPTSKQSARRLERKLSESLPVGSSGVLQGLTDCTAAIEEALKSLAKGTGTGPKALREALKRSFADGAIGGSVAKAFEGSGEGPVFTASLRRAVIRDAVEMVLTPPKDREQKKQTVFRKEFKDGSQAVQTLLNTRAQQKPPRSTKAKDKEDKGEVNFVDEILRELVLESYVHLNTKKSKLGRHTEAGSRGGDEGGDVSGGSGGRQLQTQTQRPQRQEPGRGSNDAFFNFLRPTDAFDCPDVEGCALPRAFVNDRKCDCPGTCADEDAFTCETCVPTVPFGIQNQQQQVATDVGVAVGVSLGVGIGVALGVGLGLASGIGAVFIAQGVVQFTVMNAEEFTSSPEVQLGMKRAFLRLAELKIAEEAVTLNWACAATALSQITSKLRRLKELVTLCFEIEIEGETESMDACKVLSSTSAGGAQKVIEEELRDAGTDKSIDLVQWEAEPNPKSFNPNGVKPEISSFPSSKRGINLG